MAQPIERRPVPALPTSDDVAKRAGVSRSTVSRAFTPGASIAPATLDRVMAVAEEIGYGPNLLARSLISRRSNTIGLVISELDNPFYHTVLTGFLERLQRRDLRVMCHSTPDAKGVEDGVRTMLRYAVDAVIVTSSGISSTAVRDCHKAGVPIILFNRTVPDTALSWVQTDNIGGGRMVADFLATGGYKRPAYLNGLEVASTNRDRRTGFCEHLAALGLPEPLQDFGGYSYAGGRQAVKRLMQRPDPPDAIFCANDIMAFGALDGLRHDLGFRVPDDVSVIGFDDVPMATWPSFDLTTVRQRRNRMIEATLEVLDELMADVEADPVHRDVPGELIVRGSTRLSGH